MGKPFQDDVLVVSWKILELYLNTRKLLYKPMSTQPNEEPIRNVLNREFKVDKEMSVLVSDLTYVKVGKRWNYICFFIDLYNREIVGYSVGEKKT